MKKIIQVGALIIRILIRCKLDEKACEDFTDIVSVFEDLGVDSFEAREIDRSFNKIGDNIALSCKKLLEKSNVEEARLEFIIEKIMNAYEKLGMSNDNFFNTNFEVQKLKKMLQYIDESYKDDLNVDEIELFERMLEHTAHLMINAYMKMPEFNAEGVKRLCGKIEDISQKIDEIIIQMEKVNFLVEDKGKSIKNFERQYRNQILTKNSYINLFGAGGLSRGYRRYQLSIAYVQLELNDEYEDIIKLEDLFSRSKNIWLAGEAGSGKTTFLQWLAVQVAENEHEVAGIKDAVPIFIELRKMDCCKISLNRCITMNLSDSSYTIPKGWIEDAIEQGRFVFLVDGFDEISEVERERVLFWLEEIDSQNKCRKIFTARLHVKERPNLQDMLELKMCPMNTTRIKKFVNYWVKAVLEDQLAVDDIEAKRITHKMKEKLIQSEALYKLAGNPLLCAMLCTLQYRNDLDLPTNKRALYEECCKMLIDRRDEERGIVHNFSKLDYEKKKIILAKLAYWMMKNNYLEISKKDARKVVARTIGGMDLFLESASDIFEYLLERCGILRETECDKIDFVHRSFQEYLAAYEISRNEDWGYIKEKIGVDIWQETIGMSIAYAKKATATQLIYYTLERGENDDEKRRNFFLAIYFLSNAVEVENLLRTNIELKMSWVIPPALGGCRSLAEAGNLVVPYLNNNNYDKEQRLACLRTLRMIASNNTLEVMKTFCDKELMDIEIREIGLLIEQISCSVLIDHSIPCFIVDYICNMTENVVILHNAMIEMLNYIDSTDMKRLREKQIKDLIILDYSGNEYGYLKEIFGQIEKIEMRGSFTKLDVLRNFNQLKYIKILNSNDDFTINTFNDFHNVFSIQGFELEADYEKAKVGENLMFLRACKKIKLKYHKSVEIMLEGFKELKDLQILEFIGDFAMNIDYSNLPQEIEQLIVCVSDGYEGYANYLIGRFVDDSKFTIIRAEKEMGYRDRFIKRFEYHNEWD